MCQSVVGRYFTWGEKERVGGRLIEQKDIVASMRDKRLLKIPSDE